MRAVILDHATLAPGDLALEVLWALPIDWQVHEATEYAQTVARMGDADIVLINKVEIDRAVMGACPNLKLIVIMATGTNNVDLDAARECGIAVSNIVNYSTESVVQHTFALMLALATRLIEYRADIADGRWRESRTFGLLDHPVVELHGKTLGIVGYGAIGKRVAEVARALGMQVRLAHSDSLHRNSLHGDSPHNDNSHAAQKPLAAKKDRLPLHELFACSDVISLHCPLTANNRHMINASTIAHMKPTAFLINVSRGALVDEYALAAALKARLIAGAGIDVLSEEPPVNGNPLLEPEVPNIIVTPHSAWASREARQNLINQVIKVLTAFAAGKRINQVV